MASFLGAWVERNACFCKLFVMVAPCKYRPAGWPEELYRHLSAVAWLHFSAVAVAEEGQQN